MLSRVWINSLSHIHKSTQASANTEWLFFIPTHNLTYDPFTSASLQVFWSLSFCPFLFQCFPCLSGVGVAVKRLGDLIGCLASVRWEVEWAGQWAWFGDDDGQDEVPGMRSRGHELWPHAFLGGGASLIISSSDGWRMISVTERRDTQTTRLQTYSK